MADIVTPTPYLFPELATPFIPPTDDTTSLKGGNFTESGILNRVFKDLVDLLNIVQKTAAIQSERLQFLTSWQQAYTDMLGQIHTFVANNGDGIDDPSNQTESSMRDDLNRLNATYTQEITNRRSTIASDAQALQANINRSVDAVDQFSNMATAIIQQFSTIFPSFYR